MELQQEIQGQKTRLLPCVVVALAFIAAFSGHDDQRNRNDQIVILVDNCSTLSGMERNMKSQTAAWGFMGERTDDVLTFVCPDYRFPAQPFMLLNVTPDQTTGTLELRGDLLFNKPQQSAVGYVSASCRVAD